MPKAHVSLSSGAKVEIEGTAEEVASILGLLQSQGKSNNGKHPSRGYAPQVATRAQGLNGPTALILSLSEQGYFGEPRTLAAIKQKLREDGHIYPSTGLSPALTKLVRRKLLRRFQEAGVWCYVNR
jgi:hypothetical protein